MGTASLEFWRLNAVIEGTRRADCALNPRIGMLELAEAIKSHPHYSTPLEGKYPGCGVSMGFWCSNTGPSSVFADVHSEDCKPGGTVQGNG